MIKKIIIFFSVVISFLAFALFTTPFWGKFAVTKILHFSGFPEAKIESLTPQPNGFYLTNIILDADRKSVINTVQIAIFPHPHVFIRDAVITATLDQNFVLNINGWRSDLFKKNMSQFHYTFFKKMEVNNLTTHLLTPLGPLEIHVTGSMNKESNALQLRSRIVSIKEPVSFQAIFLGNMDFAKSNSWSYDFRADDIKINTPHTELTRATLALKRNADGVIEGQALIGLLKYKEKIARQINLSINSRQNPSVIINAVGPEQQIVKGVVGKNADFKITPQSPHNFTFNSLKYYSFIITAPDITKLLSLISIQINDKENINGPVRLSLQTDIQGPEQLSWILTTEDSRIIQGYLRKDALYN